MKYEAAGCWPLPINNGDEYALVTKMPASTVKAAVDEDLAAYLKDDLAGAIDELANEYTAEWREAELITNIITPKVAKPPASLDSIARGRHLFLSKCAVCHGVAGHGVGCDCTTGARRQRAESRGFGRTVRSEIPT